jgi:hypothetical protein
MRQPNSPILKASRLGDDGLGEPVGRLRMKPR